MWHDIAMKRFLTTLEHLERGSLKVTLPDGKEYVFQGDQDGADATWRIHDARTISAVIARGDIGLTEAYRDGWWDTDNLPNLMMVGLQNDEALDSVIYGSALPRLLYRFLYLFQANTLKGSKRNIHAHYDLGNEFYKLWLDGGMSYSSALYKNENDALIQAQDHKYDRIIDRFDADAGSVLEIGCGWGGFAERALHRGDYGIKGLTLSEEQHAYAIKRLEGKANIALEDYRIQNKRYDNIVSIEMFEAVGERYWSTYFNKVADALAQKGKAVIQTITIEDSLFDRYRKGGDMIRSFIFPGGMLPSPERFKAEAAKAGLRTNDQFAFGHDYAKTLQQWLANFEAKLPDIRALGFDEGFIRVWRFYLASCIASFATGRTDVMQMELQHA